MKIRLAASSGFCFGVRRAIQMALEARENGDEVCTLGELIHNPPIVQELRDKGIEVCPSAESIQNKVVVIRSHGIGKQELETLQQGGNRIIDATCPYVKRAQEIVSSMADYPVLILGDANHPEVMGMLSYGNEQTRVVQEDTDLSEERWQKLCVVSQTTQRLDSLQNLVRKLLPQTLELRVFNTICLATTQRQDAALALAKAADLMIVIGGRNSANTRMLQQLCSAQTRSVQIETEAELSAELFDNVKFVGITAGASTPAEMILKVYNKIKEINRDADTATCSEEIPLFKEESC